jgi:glutathione S-transferase
MKLYYSPGACSLASHITLRETGAKFDLVKVNLADHKTEAGVDFYTINAKGAVPALQLDNGEVLTEGALIMQYVGDHAKDKDVHVMPKAGTMERYREAEWLNWIASEFHKPMGSLFNKDMASKAGDVIKANIDKKLAHLDKHLANHEYLMGKQFTAADGYVFTVLSWASHTGVDLSKYKHVTAFHARVGARPAVQAALKAEGLAK